MKSIAQKTSFPYAWFLAAIGFVLIVFNLVTTAVYAEPELQPSDGERLITLHEDGKERGLLTRAATLRQAFTEAGIRIDEHDMIEPGLDESLIASRYEVNVYRARPVTIIDGTRQVTMMSAYRTAKQIIEHAGMKLQNEDITTLEKPSDIVSEGAGMRLVIDRATPFTLLLYGKKATAYTQKATVGEMLEEKGVKLAANDTLSVVKEQPIVEGMTVEIWRNGKQTVTEEKEVDFTVEQIKDADREVGYKEVKTPGENGKKTVTYEIDMKNGQEVSRKEIQSVVTKEPKKQVEVVGAKMSTTFSGSFGEALARLRSCEGSYTSNTGNGYYGAYQFDIGTWGNHGGYPNAAAAPPAVQDEKAWLTYQRRGWNPWPSCARSQGLQDIYR